MSQFETILVINKKDKKMSSQITPENNQQKQGANATLPLKNTDWRFGFLRCMLAAAFLLFFQAYMIAPLIPFLAAKFAVSRETVGLMVPAYLLPYAVGTFVYGILADRYGRRSILIACMVSFAIFCGLTATAHSAHAIILWRIATGFTSSGIAVAALTLIGDLFPFAERGWALGWLFGAIAGGSAFGTTLGGLLTPLIGWQGLFLGIALLTLLPTIGMLFYWKHIPLPHTGKNKTSLRNTVKGYVHLLEGNRGQRTFSYIFLNGFYHSGVFTWLGVYIFDRYHLGVAGIGLALLGYGIPGLFGGPLIGKIIDRHGRSKILPWGMALASLSGIALIPHLPLPVAIGVITLLSLGFDMSHPLLAGIVTTLDPQRRGQAMGLNGFMLFLGFALGSMAFGWGMQHWGFIAVIGAFGAIQLILATASVKLFRTEVPEQESIAITAKQLA